jgi:hypothetical protein
MKIGSTIDIDIRELETTGGGWIQDRYHIRIEDVPDGKYPDALSMAAAAFVGDRLGDWDLRGGESGDERGSAFWIERHSRVLTYHELLAAAKSVN